MTPERMRLVEQVFTEVMAAEPSARGAALASRCAGDDQLLEEVRGLLECAGESGGVLDGSAPELVDMPRLGEDAGLLSAGTRVGSYTIRSALGVGGMGVVYVGEQARPKRTVALKVIRPGFATPSVLKRFEYEAELLGRLQHPGIAQIIEAGAAQTPFGVQPFFAMELVEGEALGRYAARAGLDARARVGLMVKVCDAVEHAHQRGVIHRDLKPANILVDASGQPKILDFGVARATGGREAEHRLTLMRTGERQLVGTLEYMSPEQVSGDASAIDTRSDVYSLGVILFELLAGAPPHELSRRSLPDAVRAIRDEDPRRLSEASPGCDRDLEVICGQALAKAPQRRYQSASALSADLKRYLENVPIEARAPSVADHVRKFARRNRGVFVGSVVAAASILGGAVFGAMQYAEAVTARGQAELKAAEADRQRVRAEGERDAKDRESEHLRRSLLFIASDVFSLAYETNPDEGRAVSVVDALKLAQRTMEAKFSEDRLSEARLRYYSALIFQSNNEIDAALPAAARASDLLAELGAGVMDERRTAEQTRVRLLSRLGRFEEADRRAADLVALGWKFSAAPSNELAMMADAMAESGRFERAESLLRQQFELVKGEKGITPLNTYVQSRRLGGFLAGQGLLDECEALWGERIIACKSYFNGGDERPQASQFIGACADQLEEVGAFGRATSYRRRIYATRSPDAWLSSEMDAPYLLAANLRTLGASGDGAAAVESVELTGTLLSLARARFGVRAPQLHRATASHIRSLLAAGRTAEAAEQAALAMATLHHETGEWEYRVSEVRQAAAEAMLAAGRVEEALTMARAEFERRSRIRGRTHPLTLESLRVVGRAMAKAGRAGELGPLCRQTVDAQLETATMASSATLSLVQACMDAMLEAGEASGAEGLARRALAERLADPGYVRKSMVDLRCSLATAAAAGRGAEAALGDLASFGETLESLLGAEHPWTERVRAHREGLATGRKASPARAR